MRVRSMQGADICVFVNGIALEELSNEDTENECGESMKVRYVEATPGKKFQVSFKADKSKMATPQNTHLCIRVSLDGKKMTSSKLNWQRWPQFMEQVAAGRSCTIKGQPATQPFVFGDLTTNEGPMGNYRTEDAKQLACGTTFGPRSSSSQSVPEKALKGRAISTKAELGEVELLPGKHRSKETSKKDDVVSVYKYHNRPRATYVFKYRSRKDLQIEGLIERSPSPGPLEERNLEDLSHAEALQLLRQSRQADAQRKKSKTEVKREKRDHSTLVEDDNDDEIEVTESRKVKRPVTSFDSAVGILDLTED